MTTPLVVAEVHGWFLKRYDSAKALEVLAFLELLEPLQIETIGRSEIEGAARYIRRYKDQDLTVADALGLWLMHRKRIRSCWSTDRHLGLTGVPLAIHSSGAGL